MTGIDGKLLKSARDIEVGSYLVEYFANSIAFYKVLSTTNKTITIIRVRDEETHFECAGGPVGYRYCKPTDKPYNEFEEKIRKVCQPTKDGKSFFFSGVISRWNGMYLYDPNKEYHEWYE